ncbi:MAG: hypothetical protein VKJ05_01895 [Synechococcaceae cyanobacterium]|nr:hypothetical protein [Synechococcaceae cyanobacterium]
MQERRQRIHELVLALLARQADLELLDGEDLATGPGGQGNAAGWLERNRRILQHYQALVRTATTLDALVDQELGGGLGQAVRAARPGEHQGDGGT